MTERRAVIAARAAVAAVAPIFLPLRAIFARRRFSACQVLLSGRWHFEQDVAGRFCIRHVDSGFGFVNEPHADGPPRFYCVAPGQTRDAESLRNCFARAATIAAQDASALRQARLHSGAIYLDYRQSDPWRVFNDIATEDAPPTNWGGHLLDWRNFERFFVA